MAVTTPRPRRDHAASSNGDGAAAAGVDLRDALARPASVCDAPWWLR